jgi:hypothetical protein
MMTSTHYIILYRILTLIALLSFVGFIMYIKSQSNNNFAINEQYEFNVTCTNIPLTFTGYKSDLVHKFNSNLTNLIIIIILSCFHWSFCVINDIIIYNNTKIDNEVIRSLTLLPVGIPIRPNRNINEYIEGTVARGIYQSNDMYSISRSSINFAFFIAIVTSLTYFMVDCYTIHSTTDLWIFDCENDTLPVIINNNLITFMGCLFREIPSYPNVYCIQAQGIDTYELYNYIVNQNNTIYITSAFLWVYIFLTFFIFECVLRCFSTKYTLCIIGSCDSLMLCCKFNRNNQYNNFNMNAIVVNEHP